MTKISEYRGLTFHHEPDGAVYAMRRGKYEACILEPDDVWLDIGAHVGIFALPASQKVQSVHAYEPDPATYRLLGRNVWQNQATNVYMHPFAVVADDEQQATLYRHERPTHNSLLKDSEEGIIVHCLNVNEVLARHEPNKLKINAEGIERSLIDAIESWDGIEELMIEYHLAILGDNDYKSFVEIIESIFSNVSHWQDSPATMLVHGQR